MLQAAREAHSQAEKVAEEKAAKAKNARDSFTKVIIQARTNSLSEEAAKSDEVFQGNLVTYPSYLL